MSRQATMVAPGVAHHVTQRGAGDAKIFFSRKDRTVYLDLLRVNSKQTGTRILAYCLMPNHIHLLCVPDEDDSLTVCLGRAHGAYSQYLNARRERNGQLWQGRFYSCPLDEKHLWTAIRYVELNPVRAGLVEEARDFPYSSAAAHLGDRDAAEILDIPFWKHSGAAGIWGRSLEVEEGNEERRRLREATYAGTPLGVSPSVECWRRPVGSARLAARALSA